MAVLVEDIGGIGYEFSCGAWALMDPDSKADWTVVENTCGQREVVGNPYASSRRIPSLSGRIRVVDPITLTMVDGVLTLALDLNRYPTYANNEEAIAGYMAQGFTEEETYGKNYWLHKDTDIGLRDTLARIYDPENPFEN